MTTTAPQRFILPDGATLAYDVCGGEHVDRRPLVLIVGRACLRTDWEPLFPLICAKRAVLRYDHRGMGDSTYSTPERDDQITVETMARDAVALVEHVGWKDVDILGFSMGGVVLQRLLLLPTDATGATALPFRVHHAVLAATLCTPLEGAPMSRASPSTIPARPRTLEERRGVVRPILEVTMDAEWIAENQGRYAYLLDRLARSSRPGRTVMAQGTALLDFDFGTDLVRIPSSVGVLVLHGSKDRLVPFAKCEEILAALPRARLVEVGAGRGQVPSLQFGHGWFEYFTPGVWVDVLEAFVDDA